MIEQEKQVFINAMIGCAKGIEITCYETLATLFEEMSKHPELSLQETLYGISITLKKLTKEIEENENN